MRLAYLAVGFVLLAQSAVAADKCEISANPSAKATGFQASIVGVKSVGSERLALIIDLHNTTPYVASLMQVGNYRLAASNGTAYMHQTGENVGINDCNYSYGDDQGNYARCLDRNSKDLANYTEIQPCDFARLTLYFNKTNGDPAKISDTLSYTFHGIARFAPVSTDPMQPAKPASPPSTVTLSFPRIPLE